MISNIYTIINGRNGLRNQNRAPEDRSAVVENTYALDMTERSGRLRAVTAH